jgi:hypothetical protein
MLVAVLATMFAASAIGQDADTPPIEVAVGYANLTFPLHMSAIGPSILKGPGAPTRRNSGAFVDVNWNRRPWFAVQNYLGVYFKLGDDVTLLTDMPGVRIAARNILGSPVTAFATAGFGFGLFTERASTFTIATVGYNHWSPAARYGAGMDARLGEGHAVRVEASRIALNVNGWFTNWNVSTGLVFRLF